MHASVVSHFTGALIRCFEGEEITVQQGKSTSHTHTQYIQKGTETSYNVFFLFIFGPSSPHHHRCCLCAVIIARLTASPLACLCRFFCLLVVARFRDAPGFPFGGACEPSSPSHPFWQVSRWRRASCTSCPRVPHMQHRNMEAWQHGNGNKATTQLPLCCRRVAWPNYAAVKI